MRATGSAPLRLPLLPCSSGRSRAKAGNGVSLFRRLPLLAKSETKAEKKFLAAALPLSRSFVASREKTHFSSASADRRAVRRLEAASNPAKSRWSARPDPVVSSLSSSLCPSSASCASPPSLPLPARTPSSHSFSSFSTCLVSSRAKLRGEVQHRAFASIAFSSSPAPAQASSGYSARAEGNREAAAAQLPLSRGGRQSQRMERLIASYSSLFSSAGDSAGSEAVDPLPPFSACARAQRSGAERRAAAAAAHVSALSSHRKPAAASSRAVSASAGGGASSAAFAASAAASAGVAASAAVNARNEQRRQALRSFISRLDELFHLTHQHWLPAQAGAPLGAKRDRRRSGGKEAEAEASRRRLEPDSAHASARCEALSAQEALFAACRLASTRGDFQWCLQGLNILTNFGRLRPDWELSNRLFALALHCQRRDQAEELLHMFPHFLSSPPSSSLLFALIDEAFAAGRPQDVRRIVCAMREQWQIPIRPSVYVAAIRAMLLLPIPQDQALREARVIAEDAAAMGVSLPPVAYQMLTERALALIESRLAQVDADRGSLASPEAETHGGEDDEGAQVAAYPTEELLELAWQMHARACADQAREASRRRQPVCFSPDFASSSGSLSAWLGSPAALNESFVWRRESPELLMQAGWLFWAAERCRARGAGVASQSRESATADAEAKGDAGSWLTWIRRACARSLEDAVGGDWNPSSIHRSIPPAFLSALVRAGQGCKSAAAASAEGAEEARVASQSRRSRLRETRDAAEALHAFQHSAFAGSLPPLAVLAALSRPRTLASKSG
ncbi:hypothetical protein BESB_019770 [Besnoitia besnoiti]|uniref:Uncharacterized protein n=1 Tax=Besnoitia besnoiti TaxID=94643 RepID=A0A2A9M800_BESBE|nr:hypothetical protein BESB_019770 [Besnoitia besnoiti]PFH32036.1 hypothetical protein BESB_019770 [Besnoitia besnoiti]